MAQDRINLAVPAKSEYARTVRMTASSLASRIGMNYDDVEDVRMAADEAFIYAVETLPDGAEMRFQFTVDDEALAIDVAVGSQQTDDDEDAERRASYAVFILESVCDAVEFASDERGPHLRLRKLVGSADGN
jgi:serine/threonine-protein kinase RsbW